MNYRFKSKLALEERKGNPFILIPGIIFAVVMGGCILVKIIVGDFRFSDISGLLFPLLIIGNYKLNKPLKVRYCMADGVVEFGNKEMRIRHEVLAGENDAGIFSEETVIVYDEIECIQYGEVRSCFRLVAGCRQKRMFADGRVENPDDGELPREYFLYVNEAQDAVELMELFQKYTEVNVYVIEDEE